MSTDHLDNDKEELTVRDILVGYNPATEIKFKKAGDLTLAEAELAIDQYTQSRLKAFAGEVEEAIGTREVEYSNLDGDAGYWEKHGRNNFRDTLLKALKAIKEKYQL